MRLKDKGFPLSGGLCLLVAALAGAGQGAARLPDRAAPGAIVADGPPVLGAPYQVGGVTYVPEDVPGYDEVGYAGQYDADASGAITAAHKTLPLPSYVEVTALDSGRTILVRINDRGPRSNDRIIDLSPGAAAQLGMTGGDPVGVRVRRVNPPEQERALLRSGARAAARLDTPPALLKALQTRLGARHHASAAPLPRPSAAARVAKAGPKLRPVPPPLSTPAPARRESPAPSDGFVIEEAGAPFARAAPPPSPGARPERGGAYVVQVAAFASAARAQALARRIGADAVEGGGVWRVRFGPYSSQDAARAGVRAAAARGFENARIMANDAR